jgi:hypothetical protein
MGDRFEARERWLLLVLSLLSLAMRVAAFFRYRFDSDEPQHLHVAWGWTAGLVQYRDLFDNHAPLFHIVTAPILAAVGERPDVLLFMRLPMLPLFALVLWATYLLGARLYSASVGAWSALILSLIPTFFLKSLEFRTDNLWNTLWMLTLAVLISRLRARYFVAGLLQGLALCVSLKTSLLIITLGLSGLITWLLVMRGRVAAARVGRIAAEGLAGFVIAPVIIGWWFAAHGAWPDLVYCVFEFNGKLTETRSTLAVWAPRFAYLPALYVVLRRAWSTRGGRTTDTEVWRFYFGVAVGVFMVTLAGFWILISPRDLLPVIPLAVIFAVAMLRRVEYRVLAAVVMIPFIVSYTHRFRNDTREHITMMRQVLRLTHPGEPLMDLKGETVYRRRPFYYIFEAITRGQMAANMIPDTIAADIVRARCHVVQADGEFFPRHGRAFMNANFLNMGRLRAAGQWIRPDGSFTIAVPGDYIVVGRGGIAHGSVDGGPNAARPLAPGEHRFARERAGERVAVLWAPALARGFSPFVLQDRDLR